MKKTTTLLMLISLSFTVKSQTYVEDFESFSLSANSAFTNTTSTPFQGNSASFEYKWDNSFNFWSGGFSYTNKHDSSTAGFGNLYGVKPYKGYNNSNNYVISQNKSVIKLIAPYKGVEGMYLTNSTYAYKSMLLGDNFAKKFGGVTGNDPDFLKVTIKGYLNGVLTTDSVEFYLADFRDANNSLDYIVSSWQWVNTMPLGAIDSLKFFMYSSDVGSFGINTPLFFGIDNFTASPSFVGLTNNLKHNDIVFYPNPVTDMLTVKTNNSENTIIQILNINGELIKETSVNITSESIDLSALSAGIYFIKSTSSKGSSTKKLIKN